MMEIARSRESIFVSQMKYTIDLLTEICMLGCRLTSTPIEFNTKLKDTSEKVLIDREKYQCLVGRMIYLFHTKPDISYTISIVYQFMQTPYE